MRKMVIVASHQLKAFSKESPNGKSLLEKKSDLRSLILQPNKKNSSNSLKALNLMSSSISLNKNQLLIP